jgi:hypothetical protein
MKRTTSENNKKQKQILRSTLVWGSLYTIATSGAITALTGNPAGFPAHLLTAALLFVPCGALHGVIMSLAAKKAVAPETDSPSKTIRISSTKIAHLRRHKRAA